MTFLNIYGKSYNVSNGQHNILIGFHRGPLSVTPSGWAVQGPPTKVVL